MEIKITKSIIALGTLGESKVGKTNLSNVFIGNKFEEEELSTIGVGNLMKKMDIKYKEKTKNITLKIWDTAGQERFRSIATQYIKNCDGILLVYSITDKKSFNKIESWIKQVEENKNTHYNVPIILVGNKIDLENERQVTFEEAQKLASEYNLKLFECSAKSKNNVNEAFECLIDEVIKIYHDELFIEKNVKNYNKMDDDGGCCKKKNKQK